MKNTFINEYNRNKRRGKVIDYDSTTIKPENENPDYPLHADLDYELHNSELSDEILLAINSLPDEYRSIMLLCYVDEFKYEELADIYDIPIGTVRSRLARARSLLKVKLKSYASSHGFDTESEKWKIKSKSFSNHSPIITICFVICNNDKKTNLKC